MTSRTVPTGESWLTQCSFVVLDPSYVVTSRMEAFGLTGESESVWSSRAILACVTREDQGARFRVLRCATKPVRALALATRDIAREDSPAKTRRLACGRLREILAAMLRCIDVISSRADGWRSQEISSITREFGIVNQEPLLISRKNPSLVLADQS